MARVDVAMVELYTAVTDGQGELVRGLGKGDFEVREDGRKQTLESATLVEDLPLVVGVARDVSGAMEESLGEAQRAASGFLSSLVRARDRCFAVAFATRPTLVVPNTPDATAASLALRDLKADGATSLYDALVLSLYYMRGSEARKALVVLSDGADTDSLLSFDEALDYARESGVMIYTVGLETEALDIGARHKLANLAAATGGRSFVVGKAAELAGVYERIERELRSQYLLAYAPDRGASGGGFRRVEVKVKSRGATARTIPGYSP
jgi:Ca-activated chloride channel family protein